MTALRQAVGDARFVFVVGKGGVGKTTAAGALALELADSGAATHLISTDPAHSIGDLFEQQLAAAAVPSRCTSALTLEEFAAAPFADHWLAHALGPVSDIIERGTYLDADDVAAFSRLALPGLDEMMAVLRLVDLADGDRVVVDTAPTGHALRLLDAAATHEGIARALRAMADKGAAVAASFTRSTVRLAGESIIDELGGYVTAYRQKVLGETAFIVATRAGGPVAAETRRLTEALRTRGLRLAASVAVRTDGAAGRAGAGDAGVDLCVPYLRDVRGCDGLRRWREALQPCADAAVAADARDRGVPQPSQSPSESEPAAAAARPALPWLVESAPRLLLFAGKGGVGKSTSAAAVALALAERQPVLLCSADPAGSIDDILGEAAVAAGRAGDLRVLQIDPARQLERLRETYSSEVLEALDQLGISGSAALDRRVIEALWDLAPPGIDELAAMAVMLDAAETGELVVLDAAPTGHFLRLLTMPGIALDWTRQLMRVIVKYGISGAAAGAAESLLQLSRELKQLQQLLRDPEGAGVMVVCLAEPMVLAETDRLLESLGDAGVRVHGLVLNHADAAPAPGDLPASDAAVIAAPHAAHELTGRDALREWVQSWNIVA